jgi:hypothetical protein
MGNGAIGSTSVRAGDGARHAVVGGCGAQRARAGAARDGARRGDGGGTLRDEGGVQCGMRCSVEDMAQ